MTDDGISQQGLQNSYDKEQWVKEKHENNNKSDELLRNMVQWKCYSLKIHKWKIHWMVLTADDTIKEIQ